MTASPGVRIISDTALRSVAADLLAAGGFSGQQAAETADLLVWDNLRGIESHGVLRIPG